MRGGGDKRRGPWAHTPALTRDGWDRESGETRAGGSAFFKSLWGT